MKRNTATSRVPPPRALWGIGVLTAFAMTVESLVWNRVLRAQLPRLIANPDVPFALALLEMPKETVGYTVGRAERWKLQLLLPDGQSKWLRRSTLFRRESRLAAMCCDADGSLI